MNNLRDTLFPQKRPQFMFRQNFQKILFFEKKAVNQTVCRLEFIIDWKREKLEFFHHFKI